MLVMCYTVGGNNSASGSAWLLILSPVNEIVQFTFLVNFNQLATSTCCYLLIFALICTGMSSCHPVILYSHA